MLKLDANVIMSISRAHRVPGIAQLRPGVAVNIVLKADQGTGKLTAGHISDILTRGDHPRGVKVRLVDGKIGRVQSLGGHTTGTIDGANRSGRNPSSYQLDYRYDEAQAPERELMLSDFIKVKTKSKKMHRIKSPDTNNVSIGYQEQLEFEFPHLDPALIGAILADHETLESTRKVLSEIS